MNPLHLLSLEWRKFSPNGTFRFFAAIYIVLFTLIVLLARNIGHGMTSQVNGTTTHPLSGILEYPTNWQVLAYLGSWMNLFVLGTLGVFMITMEFSNKTLRQSVIFGMTRLQVAVSKLIWAAAVALAATAFYFLLVFGLEILDGAGPGLPPVNCLIGFFLQALGYLCLGNLAGLFIRQTAMAVLAYLGYAMFLETVLRWIFYFSVAKTRLLLFLPEQVLGTLTSFPMPSSVSPSQLAETFPNTTALSTTEAILSVLVYLALFSLLFCRRIVKADL